MFEKSPLILRAINKKAYSVLICMLHRFKLPVIGVILNVQTYSNFQHLLYKGLLLTAIC